MAKKKKHNVQIFKLEERVLFDGAAAADIVAAVNNAGNDAQADQESDDSSQDKEEKLIQNTVQNAGPVDTPAPDANVQNDGNGLPQADAANNDPAEALIQGNADFSQVSDPDAAFSGDVADFIQTVSPTDAADASTDLYVIDPEAAGQFDANDFEGKNVLVLNTDSDAADQIAEWMNEHSDQDIDSIHLVTDSDTLVSQIGDLDADVVTVEAFQSGISDVSDDIVVIPDHEANITVDAPAAELPEELSNDAAEGRHELVILNSTTADLDNVLEQLGDSRDILVLDASSEISGVEQIQNYLAEHSDIQYDAVHIMTHGNDSGLFLGSDFVTDAQQFEVFSDHISADGDLMLYGCSTASSEQGLAFIHDIAHASGADVAASTNITGAASADGDWNLEYESGRIETVSISLDSSWNYRFRTITVIANTGDAKESATNALSLESAAHGNTYQDGETFKWRDAASNADNDIIVMSTVRNSESVTFGTGTKSGHGYNNTGITLNAGSCIMQGTYTANVSMTISGGVFHPNSLSIGNNATLTAENVNVSGTITNNGTVVGTMIHTSQDSTPAVNIGGGQWGTADKSFTITNNGTGINITGGNFTNAEIITNDGTLTISGGTFSLASTGSVRTIISASGTADVNISAGTFTGLNLTPRTGNGTGLSFSGSGTLSISGGTFQNFENAVVFSGSKVSSITGGTFSSNAYGVTHSGSGDLMIDGTSVTAPTVVFNGNVNDALKPTSGAGIRYSGSGDLIVQNLTMNANYRGIDTRDSSGEITIGFTRISNSYNSGIYNTGTVTLMTDLVLTGNGQLVKDGVHTTIGGGLYNSGTITGFTNIRIENNHGDLGGGIYNVGNIAEGNKGYAANIYIANNEATFGGGIYQDTGYFMFSSLVTAYNGATRGLGSGNRAHEGGGMYFKSGTWLLDNMTISGNTAGFVNLVPNMGEARGGGIFVGKNATVIVDGGTFANNRALSIDNYFDLNFYKYYYNDPNLNIPDVPPVTDNGGKGGGIYNEGTLTILRAHIKNNTATFTNIDQLPNYYAYLNTLAMGGGIYSSGTLTVYDSYIHGNTVTNGNGAGIYLAAGSATIASTEYYTGNIWTGSGYTDNTQNSMIVYSNTATSWSDGNKYAAGGFGGGIYADSSVNLTLDSVTIGGNRATLTVVTDTNSPAVKYDLSRGGGLYFGEAYLYQVDSKVTSAPGFGNGTLTIDGTVRSWDLNTDVAPLKTNLRPSLIFGNAAVSGSGLYITGAGTGTIGNTEIYDNDYTIKTDYTDPNLNAGGYFTNVKVAEEQFKLLINSSKQEDGSVVLKPSSTQIAAAGQLFTASGSGLYFGGAGMTLSADSVSIFGNANANSDALGGGVFATGSLFNSAVNHLNLVNTTVYNNAGSFGGGLYITDKAAVNVLDSTVAGNSTAAAEHGGGIYITGKSAALNILNSIIVGNESGGAGVANDISVESDAIAIHDMYSLFGKVLVKNSLTKQYEQLDADPTSNIGVTVAAIFEGGTLAAAWGANGNLGATYIKTVTVDGQTYYYDYSYATTPTLAISATGDAAYKGVYTAINKANSTMYYYTLSSKTVAAGETTGEWKNFSTGATASVDSSYIVTKAQNGLDRLQHGIYAFNIGAYQLVAKDAFYYDLPAANILGGSVRNYAIDTNGYQTFTDSGEYYVRAIVNTIADTVNPYDGHISLREAIRLAGTSEEYNYQVSTAIYGENPSAPVITEKFHFGTEIVFAQGLIVDGAVFDAGNSNVYGVAADGVTMLTASYYDSLGLNKSLTDEFGNGVKYRLVTGTIDATQYNATPPASTIEPFVYDATADATFAAISLTIQVANDVNGNVGRFRLFDAVNGDFTLYADASAGKTLTLLGGNVSNDDNPDRQASERTDESSANYGGVIRVSGATATLTLNTVTVDRGVANRGGGIYVSAGELNLIGSTIIGDVNENIARGFNAAGDEVRKVHYADASDRYIYTSGYGAGIYIAGGTVTVGQDYDTTEKMNENFYETNLILQNGTAAQAGGGVYLAGGSFTTNFNLYKGNGTGGYIGASESFTITNNRAVDGAGIYAASGTTLSLVRTEITGNILQQGVSTNFKVPTEGIPASHGGGIYAASGSTVTLRGVNINNNTTAGYVRPGNNDNPSAPDYVVSYGGGIYSAGTVNVLSSGLRTSGDSQLLSFQESVITNNRAVDGGGVYAAEGTFTMSGTGYSKANTYKGFGSINNNTALFGSYTNEASNTTGQGGGIYVASGASANLTDVRLVSNSATYGASENSTVNASGSNLSGRGGAVYTEGTFSLTNSDPANADPVSLNGNSANMGGAVYQNGGNVALAYLSIYNNTATATGASSGAAYYLASGTANLFNVTISNNTANRAAVQLDSGIMTMTNVTLSLNNASAYGIINVDATLNLNNTIVVGNGTGGIRNIEGEYTNDGYSLVGELGNDYTAELIFGTNTFDPTTGVISLNSRVDNPAATDGYLYRDPAGNAWDQVGNDRTKIPGNDKYAVGAYVVAGEIPPEPTVKVNTFTDDTTAGNALYSLREAIADAAGGDISIGFDLDALQKEIDAPNNPHFLLNSQLAWESGTVTIDFSALSSLTYSGTLSVKRSAAFTDTTAGMFVLTGSAALVMSDITVDGSSMVITANGAAFNLASGTSLSLQNVTVANAQTSKYGGAIYAGKNSTVTLSGTNSFSSNIAGINGGAVYAAADSTVTISGTNNFVLNSAADGGAVYALANSTVTISGTANFTTNSATTGDGGAIHIADKSKVTISGTTNFDSNIAAGNGGAVYTDAGELNLTGMLKDNMAAGSGGAVYSKTGAVSVDGAVYGNYAADGGAIYAVKGAVSVTGELSDNHATSGRGGAVYAKDGAVAVTVNNQGSLVNGAVFGNTAGTDGGAVYAGNGAVTVTINDLAGSVGTVESNMAGTDGGAIYAGNGAVTVSGKVVGNTATNSGGAVFAKAGNVSITGAVEGNRATDGAGTGGSGGAVYAAAGNVAIIGSVGSNAADSQGGAVYSTGTVSITGNVHNNTAEVDGGAVASLKTVTVTGHVYSNTAKGNGGAVYAAGGATITGNVYGNQAANSGLGGSGGAVYSTGTVTITGNVYNNAADANGGAFYVDTSGTQKVISAVSVNGAVYGNTAGTDGGAVYAVKGTVSVTGELSDNHATSGRGGGIYSSGDVTIAVTVDDTIINGAVYGNTAGTDGGAVYAGGGLNVTVKVVEGFEGNSEIANNSAGGNGGAFYVAGSGGKIIGNLTGNTGNGAAVYQTAGYVQIGDADHYTTISGSNGSSLIAMAGGNMLVYNASITGNTSTTLFDVSGGTFTLLNSTVTGNTGINDVVNQTGTGIIQIGDSTIYETAGGFNTVNSPYLINSIINVSGAVDVTYSINSLVNVLPISDIYDVVGMVPISGPNGTLKIKTMGQASVGGALVGYTVSNDLTTTTLYYSTDGGSTWQDTAGAAGTPENQITAGQNGAVRSKDIVNIGAYSLSGANFSMVVTTDQDVSNSADGVVSLREAVEIAEFLFNNTGEVQTVTFAVRKADLGNTITIGSSVNISGSDVKVAAKAPFGPGDSVFNMIGGDVMLAGLTIEGLAGVRGIDVNGANLTLSNVTIQNGDATGSTGGAINLLSGSLSGSDVTMVNNTAADGAAIKANGPVALNNVTVSGNTATAGSVITSTGDVSLTSATVSGNNATADVISSGGNVNVTGSVNGNGNLNATNVISATGDVNVTGDISSNTATANVISSATGNVSVTGSVNGNAATDVISAGGNVSVTGPVSGNTAATNVISATGNVSVTDISGNIAATNVISATGDVSVSGSVSDNIAATGDVIGATGNVSVSGSMSGNTATVGDVISATGDVSMSGSVSANTAGGNVVSGVNVTGTDVTITGNNAAGDVIGATGDVSMSGSVSDNTATAGDVISAAGAVSVSGTVSGNTAAADVIGAGCNVTVEGNVAGNTTTTGDVISAGGYAVVNGTVSDNNANGDVISSGSSASVSGTVSNNTSATGNVIDAAGKVSLTGDVTGNFAQSGDIVSGADVTVNDSLMQYNTASGSVINAASGKAVVIASTLADNNAWTGAVISASNGVTIVNDTMAYNTGNAVNAGGTAKIANSIVLGEVNAANTQAAYGVFSKIPSNLSVNDNNAFGASEASLFSGHLQIREDSVAAVGVWTAYDASRDEVYYSTRPEWTDNYNASNMQWNRLGGGIVSYASVSSYLLTDPAEYPSIGGYSAGEYHPDFGPGVNSDQSQPSVQISTFTGDWGYNSIVNSYLMDTRSSLFGADESGMGWYDTLLSELFGFRAQQTKVFSVLGNIPEELDVCVDVSDEEFEEFQETPYHAEDGTPLDQKELNAIRSAAVTGRMPEDSVHLDDAVHSQVASSLRSAELFKDSFDKALDALLGLDA